MITGRGQGDGGMVVLVCAHTMHHVALEINDQINHLLIITCCVSQYSQVQAWAHDFISICCIHCGKGFLCNCFLAG